MNDILILAKCYGGSTMYGLNTPSSDLDVRYIFAHKNPKYIVGLDRFEHIDNKQGCDEFGFEIRHFLNLLRKTNTQVLEFLFNENNWIEITPEFKELQQNKNKLIDSKRFYKSLKGYIFGERRLANGERTGALGGKRKESLDQFGFSPKNFVQLLRLTFCGRIFYEKGYYPVNIATEVSWLQQILIDIKTNPANYQKERLNELVDVYEKDLDNAYENRKFDLTFDEDFANDWLVEFYTQVLNNYLIRGK